MWRNKLENDLFRISNSITHPTVGFPGPVHFSRCLNWGVLLGVVLWWQPYVSIVQSSLPWSILILLPPPLLPMVCSCMRISLCMDLGEVNPFGRFRVCRFFVGWLCGHQLSCTLARSHRCRVWSGEVEFRSCSDFDVVLIGACWFVSLALLVPQWQSSGLGEVRLGRHLAGGSGWNRGPDAAGVWETN